MPHWSENATPLTIRHGAVNRLSELPGADGTPTVHLLRLSPDLARCQTVTPEAGRALGDWAGRLPDTDVVCFLTTPTVAASLLPHLQAVLTYQLWVAVRVTEAVTPRPDALPRSHLALLVLTRYRGTLQHAKTRVAYTYCPACKKTTKDYGGKKHTYHEYGTLLSDVWRDTEIDAGGDDVSLVAERLRDLFGIQPLATLRVSDLRACPGIVADETSFVRDETCFVAETPAPAASPLATETGETAGTRQVPSGTKQVSSELSSQLLNEDCLTALAGLPDNSVDFCFADPPYNLQKQYDRWDDALELQEYFVWCDRWLSELARVLKPGGTLAVLNIPLWTARHFQHLRTILTYQNWLAWEALSFPVRLIMPAHYAVLCFSKGDPRPLPGLVKPPVEDLGFLSPLAEGYCLRQGCVAARRRFGLNDRARVTDVWSDVHRLKHNSRRVDHPCQLPPLLMQRLFALFTRPGEMVLDCFDGAGTSSLVAHQLHRRYVGIELSPKYHALAVQRHCQIDAGEDPFAKQDAAHVPTAKNSRVERLPRQKYAVPKKTLQMEVKRIARELGRLPTRQDVKERSDYPLELFDGAFSSWGEVCAAARTTGMSELPPSADTGQLHLVLERKPAYPAG
jgi:hypothetical protein